jgi:hypothetical protein
MTEVGNVCVRRFLRLVSSRIFAVIRRLRGDIHKSLNPASLELFRQRGVITAAEEGEYKEYWRKRTSLDKHQRAQKLEINTRVLAYVDRETAALIAKARAHGIKVRAVPCLFVATAYRRRVLRAVTPFLRSRGPGFAHCAVRH